MKNPSVSDKMAASPDKTVTVSDKMATLSSIWESYAQLVRWRHDRLTEQKLQQQRFVLDKFVDQFINISLVDRVDVCIGEMRNIANELSQEFMRNVDAVTRNVDVGPRNLTEEDVTRCLEDYMLRGRGWRLLYVVERVGVKGVTQRHDLCEVLLNLLPYCSHMKPAYPDGMHSKDGEDATSERLCQTLDETYNTALPLSSCFQLIKSSRLKQLGCPSLQTMKLRRVESSASQLNKLKVKGHKEGKVRKRMTRSTPSKRTLPISKSESDNEESTNTEAHTRPEERKSRHPKYKRGLRSHIWSPLSKDDDSETDDDYAALLGHIEEKQVAITGYHLVRIILKLLLSLGELDLHQNVRGRALSATILPHILYFVTCFRQQISKHEEMSGIIKAEKWLDTHHAAPDNSESPKHAAGTDPTQLDSSGFGVGNGPGRSEGTLPEEESEVAPWDGAHRVALLKQSVRAVLTLAAIVATQQNGVRIIMNLNIFDTLLDLNILDSLIPVGLSSHTSSGSATLLADSEARVAMDMVCGLMQLMQVVYSNLPFNPSSIIDANHLTSKFTEFEVSQRIKRLMQYIEFHAHEVEKTPPSSEIFEMSSSLDSSVVTGGKIATQNELSTQTFEVPLVVGNGCALTLEKSVCGSEGTPVDSPEYETKNVKNVLKCENSNGVDSTEKCEQLSDLGGSSSSDPTDKLSHSSDVKNLQTVDPSADVVRCLGTLITTVKGIKVNYIHSMKCLKSRHRKCEYGSYYDHHHDILGSPYYSRVNAAQSGSVNPDADYSASARDKKKLFADQQAPLYCVVAELSTYLLEYISEAKFKASHVQVMSTLRSVGVCCCLQPERLISSFVPQLQHFSPAIRSYAMDTLTSMLLDQFHGALESLDSPKLQASTKSWGKRRAKSEERAVFLQESTRCVHCYLEGSSPLLYGLPSALDSGFSSCDLEEMRKQRLLDRWKSLRTFRKLILSLDENLALTCAKHLMTLAIRGNNEIKEELFFGVYLHVLHMKVQLAGYKPDALSSDDVLSETSTHLKDELNHGLTNTSHFCNLSSGSMINSQESLLDSVIGGVTPSELSSTDDVTFDGSVPSSVMLLSVSALPYVLQVDKVMSIFLAKGGLAKLTKLLEYDQLRAPVMSVFEALVMIDERRLSGNTSDNKTVYEGGSIIQTFIDTLAKRTCTVTATLQQIQLRNSQGENSPDSPPLLGEDNDFLKFYKENLSSSPKSDDQPKQIDGEDKEKRAHEMHDCVTDTNESLPVLLDMWKTCAKLCMNSRMFRACYRDSPCLYVVQETLILALSLLGELSSCHGKKCLVERQNSYCSGGQCGYSTCLNGVCGEPVGFRQTCNHAGREPEGHTVFSHQAKLEFIEAVMMVCFSCHTISPKQKRGSEDDLWLRLNSALQSCIFLEPCKLSAVFQMLLNVALPRCPSILEYSYSQIVSMLNLREKEDIADEDEVRQLLQQELDEDGEVLFTEHGYEADTETSISYDWKKGLEFSLQNNVGTSSSSCPCFPAVFRLFVELMVACYKVASRGVILHTVALRLLQTLRSSRRSVRAVSSEHLLEVLVDGFREALVQSPADGKQSTLQEIILSLVQVIAQSEMTAAELRQMLRLFQDNTDTTNSLLSTLLTVIEKTPVAPNSSITFPVKHQSDGDTSQTSSPDPESAEVEPVWQHAAVELEVQGLAWPPLPTGFSLAFWMSVDLPVHGSKAEFNSSSKIKHKDFSDNKTQQFVPRRLQIQDCLLVVAVGNKEKMFEVWVHPATASLVCRLTAFGNEVSVLKEITLDQLLTPGTWQLVVLSYKDVLDGSTFVGKLDVLVDGWLKKEIILDHPASLSKQAKQQKVLCIGDTRQGAGKSLNGTWKLGTLRLFRDTVLSGDWWFHLYCLGPNCEGIAKCDCGSLQACYTPAMLKHMVDVTHLTWDVLVGLAQLPDIDTARTCQILMYRVNRPDVYSIYLLPQAPAALLSDDLGLVPSAGSQSHLLIQKPVILPAKVVGKVKVRETNTLEKAVEQAGGVEAFLFLVAKIFEDSMKVVDKGGNLETAELLQSKVVHLLFQLIHHFPTHAKSFNDASGYAMLAKVLTSSKSIVGYHLLKVLIDACATETMFKTNPNSPVPVLRCRHEAVIRDVEVLTQLLLNWRIWHRGSDSVTVLLFRAMESLVSPSHPHHKFNQKQMLAGGVINKIFNIYLERIQDGQPSLSVDVSLSASNVVKSLLGSPPDLHLLMAVMDFLLLVHPAPSGFINFSASSFYFKMWWDGDRPRASSDQQKIKSKSKRTISEKSEAQVEEPKDTILESRLKSAYNTAAQIPSSSLRSPMTDSPIDSEGDNEGNEFTFPPLKATNVRTEQSADMDADYEESDNGWRRKNLIRSVEAGQHQDTTDISSSEQEVRQDSSHRPTVGGLVDQDSCNTSPPGGLMDQDAGQGKRSSPRRRLVYTNNNGQLVQDQVDGVDSGSQTNKAGRQGDGQSEQGGRGVAQSEAEYALDEEEEDSDQGLMALCVGLVEYLTQLILEFPETSLNDMFSKVVSPKSMLVLAKNPSSAMRLAVMKLLASYLARAPPNLIEAFIKMDGFYLLANQLRSFPVSSSHVETAMSILLRQEFIFDDNYMVGDLGDLSPIQQVAPVLLLSLMEGTATDFQLCRNSLALLSQLLESTPTMSSLLLELGLAETMCNLATSIQKQQTSEAKSEGEELTKTLLIDVQHVLCSTAVSEFSWAGQPHYQNVEDMFTLLKALEDNEFSRQSESSKKRAGTARAFQISLVVKILEYVEKRSDELTSASQGWLTSSFTNNASNPSTKPARPVSRTYSIPKSSPHGSVTFSPLQQYMSPDAPKSSSPDVHSMRRSTYSNPDMMGFLSETLSDERQNSLLDSDASGSSRVMTPPRTSGGTKPSRIVSIFGRRHKMMYATVSQSDLQERFKKILTSATDLTIMYPREEQMRPTEQRTLNIFTETKTPTLEDRYLKHLFLTIYRFYEHTMNKDSYNKRNRNPVMHGAKDAIKTQLTRLLLCMMSVKVDFDMRAYTVAFIMTEPRGTDTLKTLITDKYVGIELSFYLYNLLASWKDWLNPAQREFGFSLMLILRQSGYNVNSPDQMLTQAQVNVLSEDKKLIDARYRKDLLVWLQKRELGTSRITQKFEAVRRRVTEQAMTVTQDVTRLQIEERKKLIAHIKQAMTSQIQLKKQWQELVQMLTHERGVWYQSASYPQSWQLDPTEGPGRVRKRLQRCHLGIDRRFLLPEHQDKLDGETVDPPLLFLFEDDHQMSDSAALIYRLYTNEKIQHTCKCTAVSPASESKGELLVGEVCIFFVADGAITGTSYTQMLLGNLDQLSITWPHTDIRELHKRWYQLQDVGLEIFLISGRTCLLAFQSTKDRDDLYNILRSSLELPNLVAAETLQTVQQGWLSGEVSNYDYLMHLNKLAGRSYTDLMQYPVFPFILRDYASSVIHLRDQKIYRNLKKPVAVQDKSKEKRYKDNYEFLCQEASRPECQEEMMRVAPFHYGSHYSNSGTVLHYMVRLPPFTRMFLTFQDRNFDLPDRTFHSLSTSWRLSSFDSSTDVKELIPEFFFLPEFLINTEGFNFGQRQNGEQVNNVNLPPWCEGDPRLFVLIHRQALESAPVTSELNHWLDLVFGYKQQGEEAVKAINVFHPSTYFGVDASTVRDPLKRQALLTMIRTYGQTPKQLFRNPHPVRHVPFQPPSYTGSEERRMYVPTPVPTVTGLKWGIYLGSPDLPPPVYRDILTLGTKRVTRLVALPTGPVFGVERTANIILLHGKQRDMAVKSMDVMWAGVITWGYHDNIIRIRSYQDKPLINFVQQSSFGKVTCVESVPDCRLLFTAGTSGIIHVFTMTHNSSKPSNLQLRGVRRKLCGHSGPITCLSVCQAFSILVSASSDGTCIIWDLNRLTYVRSITSHCAEVSTLTISDTLGDIASVSHSGDSSILQLHTVNASHVATVKVSDTIHCLAYSSAPEGRSVNVVAGGLESGSIRLWSSWDLSPLKDLTKDNPNPKAVIGLTFSADSQYLMASSADGLITLWGKDLKSLREHSEKFIPVISSQDGEK